ncbi:hypothetical protein KAI87_14870, partial [Myxococcota bacterium]|nr:hypothetical protein [Myxococcota bacterium]
MATLPVQAHLSQILSDLSDHGRLVLSAEPGAGKTTLVPPALMDSDLAPHKKIWVLEPRRLAARSAARHIAATRGEKPGDSTG